MKEVLWLAALGCFGVLALLGLSIFFSALANTGLENTRAYRHAVVGLVLAGWCSIPFVLLIYWYAQDFCRWCRKMIRKHTRRKPAKRIPKVRHKREPPAPRIYSADSLVPPPARKILRTSETPLASANPEWGRLLEEISALSRTVQNPEQKRELQDIARRFKRTRNRKYGAAQDLHARALEIAAGKKTG